MKFIKYIFTILLVFFISGLSLSFQNCNISNQSEKVENDFLRVFAFSTSNEKQTTKTYLSLKGQLKDDKGKPLANALMSLNASGISSNQQRANTRAGTSSIRCVDYDLKKSNAQCFKIIKPDLFTKKSVDGCYEVYYGSTENHKAKLIAKIKKVSPGQSIQYYFASNILNNITHFKVHSCSGELLAEEIINDTSDGTITDSNGNYTIKLELGKVSIISVKTPTKDYGEIKVDLTAKTTGESAEEIKLNPSKLPITIPTAIQTIVEVSVVSETVSTSSNETASSSTNTGGSIDAATLVGTATTEIATSTTPTNTIVTLPSVTYSSNSYTFTKDLLISTITPTIIGIVTSCSVSPVLPTGLSLNSTTCAISGTPTVLQATTDYIITVSNSSGSKTTSISITINTDPPSALTYSGTPFTFIQNTTIANQTPTITGTITGCTITPALPTGLSLDSATCAITGTPTALQAATNYTVTANNAYGSTTATINITINIQAPSALSYAGTPFVFTKDVVITSQNPTVTGTVASYSITPTLPTGLNFNVTTGQISGTPTNYGTATGWGVAKSYTITASNITGSVTTTISITMNHFRLWAEVQTILTTEAAKGGGTETISFIGSLPGTSAQWTGAVLAQNGMIYGMPRNANTILKIDPNTDAVTTIPSPITGTEKWTGGVLAPNGIIYGIPRNAGFVLRIDPNTDAVTTISTVTGTDKYVGGVLAPNGKIYAIPSNAVNILVIDPSSETTYTFGSFSGTGNKWGGGVLAPNGKIYGIPWNSDSLLVIDPVAETAYTVVASTAGLKWVGGALGVNGKVYASPVGINNYGEINTIGETISLIATTTSSYGSSVLAPNGKIYSIPFSATVILSINSNQVVSTFGTVSSNWESGVLAPNGKIYCMPINATQVLVIDTKSTGVWPSDMYLSPYFNKY